MSTASSATIRCTKCRVQQRINIWESITANLSPELKVKVLDGTFFRHTCTHCANRLTVTHSVLYNDPTTSLAIWLCDGGVTSELEDAMDSFGMVLPKTYTLRVVYTVDELAEKVRIFDCGLNDWFVHMVKMSVSPEVGAESSDIHFLGASHNRGGLFSFAMRLPDGQTVNLPEVPNVVRTCQQWSNLESKFDWLHVSDKNFFQLFKQYGHLLS